MISIYKGEIEMKKENQLFEEIKKNKGKIIRTQREANLDEEEMKDVFIPTHHPDDNQLCRTVKQMLIDNPVNLKLYRDRFSNDQEISNMRGSLAKNRTMTWERFQKWCFVLGYDAEIVVSKKEDDEY